MGNESTKLAREIRNACRASIRLVWNRSAVGRVVGCPADDLLLRAPDYSPDIQHHHPTHAAAEADGEQAIAFPAVIVEAQEQPRGGEHDDGVKHREHRSFVEHAFAGNGARIHEAQATVQMPKKVPIATPEVACDVASAFLASEATMLPQ